MAYKIFKPPSEWTPPDIFPIEIFKDADEIAIDLETRDPNLKSKGPGYVRGDGEAVGISIACDGYADYFPFSHEAGFNFPKKRVIDFIKEICALPCDKIFHNATYDVGWLHREGVTVKGRIMGSGPESRDVATALSLCWNVCRTRRRTDLETLEPL